MIPVFVRSVIIAAVFVQGYASQLKKLQKNHRTQQLSNSEIRYVAGLSNVKYTNEVLNNILIPRVVGTPNHEKVFQYIKKELQNLGWNTDIDEFENNTPIFGRLKFRNIIATLNPNADRYLVLACHYDSKYFEKEVFVGATDSAVPCAMLLNLAKELKNELGQLKDNRNLNLKLVFFDGEEAFHQWGPNDSIYGAKHLAEVYGSTVSSIKSGESVSELEKMDMLVLLDLIGHRGTKFLSHFSQTEKWFIRLAEIEDNLSSLGLMKKPKNQRYFVRRASHSYIEDDHIPFMQRDVPILHLISTPFPNEWHTPQDDRSIIDMNTVEDINNILRVFLMEYLHIYLKDKSEEIFMEKEL
ncbi:unnamed protein product [Acanthoscelides obtectus]|uniref:Glutaminyl-peptide cyclotransferase n=1 Tax=Acanthoscelides obtectus TaxID=200917 RepID=A0A9P0Q6Z2_ACAOB|nr:unnamed protein product [Acanthoscelides obtectus]CAK1670109.1 Glutaminyl-peptide cyclotransferase [Acanthoscelides obtectus]